MTQYDMTINIPGHCHISMQMQTQSRSQKYERTRLHIKGWLQR